jgi:hypothetical protein
MQITLVLDPEAEIKIAYEWYARSLAPVHRPPPRTNSGACRSAGEAAAPFMTAMLAVGYRWL